MKQLLYILLGLILISVVGKSTAQVTKHSGEKGIREPIEKCLKFEDVSLLSLKKAISNSLTVSEDTTIFSEGFEGDLFSFTTIDANNDSSTWSLYSESSSGIDVAYEGDKGAGSYSGYRTNDDYMISSAISLPAGSQITYSFYARSRDAFYLEDFNVKLSTTGKAVSDFSITIAEIRDKSTDWELMEYNLTEYAGQTVYLAFHSMSNDKWELYIDNVKVVAGKTGSTVSADFMCEKPYGQVPASIQFTDKSLGDISSWLWNFGDGTTSSEQNPSHSYLLPGYYNVTLEVGNGISSNSKTVKNFVTIIDDYSKYNWNSLYVPDNNGSYMETYFFDEDNGFIFQYDQSQNLLRTTNGGKNWTQVEMPDETFMDEIDFADSQNGYIRTSANYIFKSIDGGETWTKIELPNTYYYHKAIDMAVISSGTVILTLDNSDKDVIKTVDGGSTWTVLGLNAGNPKYLSFVNDTMGFITSQSYEEAIELFKTLDGGETWTQVASIGDGTQAVKGINFYSEEIGFIYGYGFQGNDMVTAIWKTIDGGLTTSVYERIGFEISDLVCLTPDFVFFSGNDRLSNSNPQILTLNFEDPNNMLSWGLGEVYTLFFVNPTKAYAGGSKDTYVFKKNTTSSESLDSEIGLKVYPNPADDKLQIQYNNLRGEATIELVNSNGQVFYISKTTSNKLNVIDVTNYSPGMYFVRIISERNNEIRKIIIR